MAKTEPKIEPKGFDFSSTIEKIQSSVRKENKNPEQFGLGNTLPIVSKDPSDYVVMPDWWRKYFGVYGLPFGRIIQIAGDSDTGKTSLALEAMFNAQKQRVGIIYVETEGKTSEQDFINKGISPEGVMTIRSAITEEAFDGALKCWSQFFKDYPKEKLLLIFDSYGNTVSMRDSALDMTKESQKPGGAAKTNRMGLNTMIARMQTDPVAILIVNYTYGRMDGGRGQVNAGGKALNFFSTLILQSYRLGWIDKTKDKVKVRLGAKVRWKAYKNHFAKTLVDENGKQILLPSYIDLTITGEGFKELEKSSPSSDSGDEEIVEDGE